MNLLRIWAVASNGFREVIRDRLLYFVGFFALLLILASRILPEISAGTDEKIFLDFGIAAISVLNSIVAIFVGTTLVNKEIEKRTLLVLIPKPLSRAEFIVGKHLGLTCVLTLLVSIMTLFYLVSLSLSKISYPLGSIIVAVIFLLIQIAVLIGVAIAFGVFTSSILATLLTFGIYLMGQISRDLLELGKITKNANVEGLTRSLYIILPDFSRLNYINEAVYGILPSPEVLLSSALYGLCYTGLLLVIAIAIFSVREF